MRLQLTRVGSSRAVYVRRVVRFPIFVPFFSIRRAYPVIEPSSPKTVTTRAGDFTLPDPRIVRSGGNIASNAVLLDEGVKRLGERLARRVERQQQQ